MAPQLFQVKTCWLLFDAEKKGSENQCHGLGEALAFSSISTKPLPKSNFLRFIPRLFWPLFLRFKKGILLDISREKLPDFIISSGTRASAVAAFLKKKSPSKIQVVNILNPRLPPKYFDLIIAPEHDDLKGGNILNILGSLHAITAQKLQKIQENLPFQTRENDQITVAILLGGPSKSFHMTQDVFENLGRHIRSFHEENKVTFLVSVSRRTPLSFKDAFLKETKGISLKIYDPTSLHESSNPYLEYLSLADYILVSADSISMVAEACSTGKPVYTVGTENMPPKFQHFHKTLKDRHYTRPFVGQFDFWEALPLNETQRISKKVKELLKL